MKCVCVCDFTFFQLEYDRFTLLYYILLYHNVNQLYLYIYPPLLSRAGDFKKQVSLAPSLQANSLPVHRLRSVHLTQTSVDDRTAQGAWLPEEH